MRVGERSWGEQQGRGEILPTPLACRDAEKPGEGAVETLVVQPWLRGLGEAEYVLAYVV